MRTLPLPLLAAFLLTACAVAPPACPPPGSWVSPGTGRVIPDPLLAAAARPVVLLGEHHDNAADHEWQLASIETLHRANPNLVLGFEMFPRAAQPALDRWVRGDLDEPAFLDATDWKHAWGMDPALYMPIFRYARDHRIPMRALNVSSALVHRVAKSGWAAIPPVDREGVGTPAPPTKHYRDSLADAMAGHGGPAMTQDRLAHFIDAQSLWDRAMAEAIATERHEHPASQVVAIMGAGHLEDRDGVPHQLEALGISDSIVLLQQQDPCEKPDPDQADAVHIQNPPYDTAKRAKTTEPH